MHIKAKRVRRSGGVLCAALVAFVWAGCNAPKPEPTAPAKPANAPAPISESPAALFEEAAERAGVRFKHTTGGKGRFLFIESTPAGCALFDYDDDGFLDLLLIQSGPSDPADRKQDAPLCALYHNNKDGTFTEVTQGSGFDKDLGYGHGVAVGDYDNDGYPDVFITSYGRNHLFHNERGTGKFADVTAAMGLEKPHSTGYATSAAFGDYDLDGKLDLYVCYYCPWKIENDRPCKDPNGNPDFCSPQIYPPDRHTLFHNEGGRFADVSEKAGIHKKDGRGLAVAFYDYNQDGKPDIFVANDLTPNMLWKNNGNGTFTEIALEAGVAYDENGTHMAAMGIAIADYDRSGFESVFVSNFSGLPNTLFKNDGSGMFQNLSSASGLVTPHLKFLTFGCEFFDYDNDGWADLVNANGHVQIHADTKLAGVTFKERKQLFRNAGAGRFAEITEPERLGALGVPMVSRGVAVGDFDNDGRVDMVFMNQNDPTQVFHNRVATKKNWVMFKPIGVKSNRDGRHTRFLLRAGGVQQSATVRAGSSYLSVSDSRVHFGLGDAAKIDRVELRWASGQRETLENLAPNKIYIVTEGKGITGEQPVRK